MDMFGRLVYLVLGFGCYLLGLAIAHPLFSWLGVSHFIPPCPFVGALIVGVLWAMSQERWFVRRWRVKSPTRLVFLIIATALASHLFCSNMCLKPCCSDGSCRLEKIAAKAHDHDHEHVTQNPADS